MTYSTGTVTSSTPGQALIAALDAAILAVTGWSKVTSALVVGTFTWNVYKCAGANNSFGTDFYIALGYVTASGLTVKITLFEQWNSGTNLATNFSPNTSQVPTGTFANPQAAAALPSTGTTMAYIEGPSLVTTGFNYGITVTADRFIFWARSSTTDIAFYAGLFDPFLPVANDPFPICVMQFAPNGSASGQGGPATPTSVAGLCTRAPNQASSVLGNFCCGANGSPALSWTQNATGANEGYTGKVPISRVLLQGQAATYYRGLLKDIYTGPSQTQNGDTITWTLNSVNHTSVRVSFSSFGLYADQL